HIVGTIRIAKRSIRLRESTGLPADAEHRDDAQALLEERLRDIRQEVIYGVRPSVPVAVAADQYLTRARRRPLGATTIAHVKEIARRFRLRKLSGIAESEWTSFVDRRNAGNAAESRERYLNSAVAFLTWCKGRPRSWIEQVPHFDRDRQARNPSTRKRRRVA